MDAYKIASLLRNNLRIEDPLVKTEVKKIYDSIKIHIREVIVSNDNLVVILLKNRISLEKYKQDAKNIVLPAAKQIIDLVYNNASGNIFAESFYVGKIIITAKHSMVDPKAVQRKQVATFKKIFKDLYMNSSSNTFSFVLAKDTHTITDYTSNKVIELPNVGSTNKKETKADMIIKTDNGDLYISLKGNTFRQWGGLTQIIEETEVKDFVNAAKVGIASDSNVEYIRKVSSSDVINKSIYGKDYGNAFGTENVNYVIIGESISISSPNNTIKASHIYKNGQKVDATYSPYFLSRKDSGRNDQGIQSTRLSIWPGKRNNAKEI